MHIPLPNVGEMNCKPLQDYNLLAYKPHHSTSPRSSFAPYRQKHIPLKQPRQPNPNESGKPHTTPSSRR